MSSDVFSKNIFSFVLCVKNIVFISQRKVNDNKFEIFISKILNIYMCICSDIHLSLFFMDFWFFLNSVFVTLFYVAVLVCFLLFLFFTRLEL